MDRLRVSAIILTIFMTLSISACSGNKDMNKEKIDDSKVSDVKISEESNKTYEETDIPDDNSDESGVKDNEQEGALVGKTSEPIEHLIGPSVADENSVGNKDIKDTDFVKYMTSAKEKLKLGKKINVIMSDSENSAISSYYMVDGKTVICSESDGIPAMAIVQGDKMYTVLGESYYESSAAEEDTKGIFNIYDNYAENITLIKIEDGYEYFRISEDDNEDKMISKVNGEELIIYRGDIDNIYAKINITSVTAEDISKADINKYKKMTIE